MSSVPPPPPPGGDQPSYDPNQPAYGQGSFGPPPGYGPPPGGGGGGQQNNSMAITSLVLGILGFPLLCCWGLGGLLSIAAIITGSKGKKAADASQGRMGGKGMAQAGFILGIIGTVLAVILIALVIIGLATGEGFEYQYGTDFSS